MNEQRASEPLKAQTLASVVQSLSENASEHFRSEPKTSEQKRRAEAEDKGYVIAGGKGAEEAAPPQAVQDQ